MSYASLTDEQREYLAANLTLNQLHVVTCRLNGHSFQRIGDAMNLDEATVRGHWKRAIRRIANAQQRDANEQTAA